MTSRHETRRAWISRDSFQAGIITIGSGVPLAAWPAALGPALAAVAGRDSAAPAAAVVRAVPARRPSHWRRAGCGTAAASGEGEVVFMVVLIAGGRAAQTAIITDLVSV
ncbi:hypothetical protein D3C81_1650100 [compost metagenome]